MTTRSRLASLLGTCLLTTAAFAVTASPAQALPNGCSDSSARASAQSYLDALQDGSKADAIPLTWDVVRYENGLLTAYTAPQLRLDLKLHLQYQLMSDLRNVSYSYAPDGRGDVVRADFDLTVGLPGYPTGVSHVREDFTVTPTCRIKRIVAKVDTTYTPVAPKTA